MNSLDLVERLGELRPKLHRFCARMTGSAVDGEDVVQNVLVKALSGMVPTDAVRSTDAGLFRVAHNAAVDHLRDSRRFAAVPLDDVADDLDELHAVQDPADLASVGLAIFMRLAVAQRSSVILMDVLGYTLEEIAGITGGSVASVKSALHRGRTRLRQLGDLQQSSQALPPLPTSDRDRLSEYVRRFNAREFDLLRDMLADDVRLDLVGRRDAKGKALVGNYFSNYSRVDDWHMEVGTVDWRAAILVYDQPGESRWPVYFILLDWDENKLKSIRDFRYARYVMEGADLSTNPWKGTHP